ncbi:MAG: metal-dependent transcriptional regulator [Candidatus Gastranaerophilales bacterium]|nr:metal-dependent transcriptional regulator [Candidatus Gastranaerophilales bacterium]
MNELTQSLEKYLLAVYEIVKTNKAARVKDVCNYLKIGAPAVSAAIKTLAAKKYINYVPYGIITISAKGRKKAEEKIKRHKIISNFLEKVLLVENFDKSAHDIEYSMPEDVLDKFITFLNFMENCTCKEPKWLKSCKYYMQNGSPKDICTECAKNKKPACNNNGCCGC